MYLYLIGLTILLVILFYLYLRIKYKFWSIQPVFHFYDVYYWIYNVGIIRHELPEKNKYCNFKDIYMSLHHDFRLLRQPSASLADAAPVPLLSH